MKMNDNAHQLTSVNAPRPSDVAHYRYAAAGNPVDRAELGFPVTNSFNNLNQIVSGVWTGSTLTVAGAVNYPAGSIAVNGIGGTIYPDGSFAVTNVPVSLGTNALTAVYNGPAYTNAPTVATDTVSVVLANAAYTHDANGNLASDATFIYQYDTANQLTNVVRKADNARVLSCRYDALGRRIEAIRSDGTGDAARLVGAYGRGGFGGGAFGGVRRGVGDAVGGVVGEGRNVRGGFAGGVRPAGAAGGDGDSAVGGGGQEPAVAGRFGAGGRFFPDGGGAGMRRVAGSAGEMGVDGAGAGGGGGGGGDAVAEPGKRGSGAGGGVPEGYMALHQHDASVSPLWLHFQTVIAWVRTVFPHYRAKMKGLDWGRLFREYGPDSGRSYDPAALEKRVAALLKDDEVQKDAGIWEFLLSGEAPHLRRLLHLRTFSEAQKEAAYERQEGKCAICGKHFEACEMQGDHIVPWSKGGKTLPDNLQMLCPLCNQQKGGALA